MQPCSWTALFEKRLHWQKFMACVQNVIVCYSALYIDLYYLYFDIPFRSTGGVRLELRTRVTTLQQS